MDSLSLDTQHALQLLIYGSIVLLTLISIFLIKLIIDFTSLVKSLQSLVVIVKHDLAPTMKEFKRALININSLTQSTNSQFKDLNSAIKEGLGVLSSSTSSISSKTKLILEGIKQGISTGFKIFTGSKKD